MAIKNVPNTYTWNDLASFLGVKSPDAVSEDMWESACGGDYGWATPGVVPLT